MKLYLEGRIPSKKNSKRLIQVHGRVIPISSKAWIAFEKEAVSQLVLQIQHPTGLEPPYMVNVKFYIKGNMRTDIDNLLAGVFDLLQKSAAIHDDSQINSVVAFRSMGHDSFHTEIELLPSNFGDREG